MSSQGSHGGKLDTIAEGEEGETMEKTSGPISRTSLNLVYSLIQKLDNQKREIVTSIGWGGILTLPPLKLNTNFVVWLLSKVEEGRSSIVVSKDKVYKFDGTDVGKVFGIPSSGRDVRDKTLNRSEVVFRSIRSRLGITSKDTRSCKPVQAILERDYHGSMSASEIESFKTAFVVFMMTHLFAPTTKYDYFKVHECLRWLDAQPDKSVVFLSFGSMGTFPRKQLEETAVGLERSRERFMWVVRSPRGPDQRLGDPLPPPDLDALMPDGFLERTKGTGLVVKSWASQVEVLRHRATGAFVTHCGWNSTLEGITAGLPLLCWPLYAEQQVNKVHIVEEMKLGVEMRGYNQEVVKAQEVEEKVRWIMASQDGKALRARVAAAKDAAAEALNQGGSSHSAFVQFLNNLHTSKPQTLRDCCETCNRSHL